MLELMLDLLDRAAKGFLFALPAAIFWFAVLCFRKRGRTAQHMGLSLVFLFYLSGVLAVTGIGRPFGFFPRLALVPFVDMIKGASKYNTECAAVFAAGRVPADFVRRV